jgi:hypothetical protein
MFFNVHAYEYNSFFYIAFDIAAVFIGALFAPERAIERLI